MVQCRVLLLNCDGGVKVSEPIWGQV